MRVLGISAFYHDAAACLVEDGRIVAAAQEERFTRKKHDDAFPIQAIRYCLAEGGVPRDGIDLVAWYEKPLLKVHRILSGFLADAPGGLRPFVRAIPRVFGERFLVRMRIDEALEAAGLDPPERVVFCEHHESHAASAFFASPFEEAAVLTVDGVGEWATTTLGSGRGSHLVLDEEIRYPDSLGLLYSAFTYLAGFRPNSGEYKLMGLAPFGRPVYVDRILDEVIELLPEGGFRLRRTDLSWQDDAETIGARLGARFDGPPRQPESPIGKRELDLARSIQAVLEEAVMGLARRAHRKTGAENLCLAGGVALNCVANGRLKREGPFARLWTQPAAGDAGGALGAALLAWHHVAGGARIAGDGDDAMEGAFLGPAFPPSQIRAFLDRVGARYQALSPDTRAKALAERLAEGAVVAVFDGRMEFGPRALGNRSILADPRPAAMRRRLNEVVKLRETFRPFAPVCRLESVSRWFELDEASPYMSLTAQVAPAHRIAEPGGDEECDLEARIDRAVSTLPAITHVDGSARVQTADPARHPGLHGILEAFEALTGCGVLLNTSFNVRGEPIVCTPEDAYRCFLSTGIDQLAMGPFLLDRRQQTASAPPPGGGLALD